MTTAIYWFRQDLRVQDNPALSRACQEAERLIPIYINEKPPSLAMGGAQKWWLHHSLASLKSELVAHELDLYLLSGNPQELLLSLIQKHKVDTVYWNRCYEPMHIARDTQIKAQLKGMGVEVVSCNGSLLNEPWGITNQSGSYFKVFTPYWRQCIRYMPPIVLQQINHWPKKQVITSERLESWSLLPAKPNWAREFSDRFQPGSAGAAAHLERFIDHGLYGYRTTRNQPAKSATSRLSPHLHFGEISPQQIWVAIQQAMRDPRCDVQSAETFLAELGWREFSYHLLYHFPKLMSSNFKSQFDQYPWQNDDASLKRWQQGVTGYPIVDAGMRELWRTGYMHNRVRMIVASFLIKDLLIDWRKGAEWFWDTLLDADLASNSASWQWVAGSGADAAPYYRIFNPVLQGEKFDPDGEYVARWVPELAQVPRQWIHQPWAAPAGTLPITVGIEYPEPIVDHASARKTALEQYQLLKSAHQEKEDEDDA